MITIKNISQEFLSNRRVNEKTFPKNIFPLFFHKNIQGSNPEKHFHLNPNQVPLKPREKFHQTFRFHCHVLKD